MEVEMEVEMGLRIGFGKDCWEMRVPVDELPYLQVKIWRWLVALLVEIKIQLTWQYLHVQEPCPRCVHASRDRVPCGNARL